MLAVLVYFPSLRCCIASSFLYLLVKLTAGCCDFNPAPPPPGEDAMTGDTDKYLRPQDLKELGDDSLPQEGYMGFSIGARSAR